MQDVFRRIIDGEMVFSSTDEWEAFAFGYKRVNRAFARAISPVDGSEHRYFSKTADEFRAQIEQGFVWMITYVYCIHTCICYNVTMSDLCVYVGSYGWITCLSLRPLTALPTMISHAPSRSRLRQYNPFLTMWAGATTFGCVPLRMRLMRMVEYVTWRPGESGAGAEWRTRVI